MGLGVDGVGAQVGHGPGLFLVQGEDLDAARGGDGEGRVEEIDAVALGRDVELVVFAEELGLPAVAGGRGAAAEGAEAEAGSVGGGFLEDGLEHLEGRVEAVAFLVEDEGTVFLPAGGEEADVFGAGELLWGFASGGVGGGGGGVGGWG